MSKLLKSGQTGHSNFNLSEQRKVILNNWKESGLLDGLKGESKMNIAELMESKASEMLNKGYGTVEYHTAMYNRHTSMEHPEGAVHQLQMLIIVIEGDIIKNHCT